MENDSQEPKADESKSAAPGADGKASAAKKTAGPAGEPDRPDPTRYGDWEKNGRCIDF